MRYFKNIIVLVLLLLVTSTSLAAEKITIASWNIQNFGKSKVGSESKMSIIAEVLSRYDIIAVQEISNVYEKSDEGCPAMKMPARGIKAATLSKMRSKNTSLKKAIRTMLLFSVLTSKTSGIFSSTIKVR